MRAEIKKTNNKKILIIKHGSLGDIIFALEPILAIQQNFSDSVIDLLTDDKFINFFHKMKIFNRFIVDKRKGFLKTFFIIMQIITGKYDLIIDLQNSQRTNLYNFFIKIFSKSKINGSRYFSHYRYLIPQQGTESPTEGLFEQLKLINIEKKFEPNFEWLKEDIHNLKIHKNRNILVIPGASKSGINKKWPSKNYTNLCLFLENLGYSICLVGTKNDEDSIHPILKKCKNVINLIDKSPPEIIYSVACESKLIITNDTGPGHIASLSNVNILWLAIDNKVTKSNLINKNNSYLILKNQMKNLELDEVINFIINEKLIDKI